MNLIFIIYRVHQKSNMYKYKEDIILVKEIHKTKYENNKLKNKKLNTNFKFNINYDLKIII